MVMIMLMMIFRLGQLRYLVHASLLHLVTQDGDLICIAPRGDKDEHGGATRHGVSDLAGLPPST